MTGSIMEAAARVDAVGGAGASFGEKPKLVVKPAPDELDEGMKVAAKETARKSAVLQFKAIAQTIVALAREMAGHDPRHTRPSDVMAAETVAALLVSVYDAEKIELPAAFRQASTPEEIAKGEKVAAALADGDAG